MLTYEHAGLEVDSCPECFGLWLDREELKALLQRPELSERLAEPAGETAPVAARAGSRLCPSCHQELSESTLGEIYIDVCLRCRGIWLDQGELTRAVEQYRQGRRGNLVVINQIAEGLRAQQQGEQRL
jgi:Zn-finger nucleic acid-binding protein